MDTEELVQAFDWEIWWLHSVLDLIVTDHSLVFTSKFWLAVCYHMGIQWKLLTVFHPAD